ncbi:L,D-transpeptidase family protein [Arthrobacter antioxidans]|uniref:L,D-transpeptidase family protein n=1 Tax=Arthrobacter antioxidans TaxID=2895818 RepID=UPI0022A9C086|nr:L,D-transpeptidase family protein [Arthrobacter antioxidans]
MSGGCLPLNHSPTSLPARALAVVSLAALLLSGLAPGAAAAPAPSTTGTQQSPPAPTPPATAEPATAPPAAGLRTPTSESPEALPEPSTSGSVPSEDPAPVVPAVPGPTEPSDQESAAPVGPGSDVPLEGTAPAVPEAPEPTAAPEARNPGAAAAAAGPFTPIGGIAAKWRALGGATGVLGEPTSNESCTAAGLCVETFVGGEIHYTPSTGAHAVLLASGNTGPRWAATGGLKAFGHAITDEQCTTGGCSQRFSSGIDLTWSTTAGHQRVWTRGAIGGALYTLYGGYAAIGYPSSAEVCGKRDNGCVQEFGGLRIVWSASSGAYGVWAPGAIGGAYSRTGAENGWLGYPTSREICGLRSAGCKQTYQRGVIAWSPATGAHISRGGMLTAWSARGAQDGALGYPLEDEVCGQANGGCVQKHQGGSTYWSPATGGHSTNGDIGARHQNLGAHTGYLGYPLEAEVCGQRNGGCYQRFQGGVIFWSPATGSQPVRGGMKTRYESLGRHLSYLGYPQTPERCEGGECVQPFQGGYISWKASGSRDHRHTECTTLNDGRSKYSTGGAKRVLLTIAGGYGRSSAKAVYCQKVAGSYVTDWQTDATVGASGFKRPGVPSGPTRFNYSPTGSYSVTEAFGLGNPGTALPYRTLNPRSRWGGNPNTSTYNKYFESSTWVGYDEDMWYFATRATHDYRQGAVINYNRPPDSPIVQDAGFAIFLHQNKVPTAGCIALDDWAVVDYLRKSTPGDRIIMGVAADLFR